MQNKVSPGKISDLPNVSGMTCQQVISRESVNNVLDLEIPVFKTFLENKLKDLKDNKISACLIGTEELMKISEPAKADNSSEDKLNSSLNKKQKHRM